MLEKKTYPLKHALAYETTIDDEQAIAVVLSGQAVSSEKLKEAKETEKEGNDPDFKRPFLRLVFTNTGAFKHWSASAGGTMLGRRSGSATGELKLQDGRVIGKASQPLETEGMFPSGFDAQFDVALLKAGESLPASTVRKGRSRREREADGDRHLQRQRQGREANLRLGTLGRAVQRQAGNRSGFHGEGSFQR